MNSIKKGFYYHFKHDSKGTFNNYAYEVLGTARHSEDHSLYVVYLPLYKNSYKPKATFCIRPLEMFMEKVESKGKLVRRFRRITNPHLIHKLKKTKTQLYGK
jgi:hypothetical protein